MLKNYDHVPEVEESFPICYQCLHVARPLNITPLNPQSFACCAVTVPISTNRCFQIRFPVDIYDLLIRRSEKQIVVWRNQYLDISQEADLVPLHLVV